MRSEPVAVLGAGHGGQALAAELALRGCSVRLYNRSPQRVQQIQRAGGIWLEGAASQGWAQPGLVTTNLAEALQGVAVILIVTPATAHVELLTQVAPLLRGGELILLCPGRTLGAWQAANTLRQQRGNLDVTVAECNTFLFASRTVGPARSRVYAVKAALRVAALPHSHTWAVVERLRTLWPGFFPATSLLETGLDNMGMLFHPLPVLANLARVEGGHRFEHYTEGISPAVARIIEALDQERLAVARRLGVRLRSARQWLLETYGGRGRAGSLYDAMQQQDGYRGIPAPHTLSTRYLSEDVPCGLVPLASLGRAYGVETPVAEAVVHLTGVALGQDWWRQGRTLERLGLAGLSVKHLRQALRNGTRPWAAATPELAGSVSC